MNVYGKCPYLCENKTDMGYCKTTACINSKYNGYGTTITLSKEEYDRLMMESDPDYGRGTYA